MTILLKYSDKLKKESDGFEIEDFIDNKKIKDIFIKRKGDKTKIENKLKDVPDWKQSISKSFNDYITSLSSILDIEQDKN